MRRPIACGTVLSWLAILSFSAAAAAQPRSWPGLPSKHAPHEDDDEPPEVERLSREELRQRLPALRTRAEPRVVQGSLGFGVRLLYLPLGVEGTLDLYPLPWLRVGLVYAAGFGVKWDGIQAAGTFAQYGEAMAGFRLWATASEADVDLQLRRSIGNYGEALPKVLRPRSGDFAEVLPVWLPSSHQLFAEGGALTGYTGLLECTTGCGGGAPEYRSLARQVLIPFAGFRYVYYSEALNAKPSINRVRYGQLFAHVLLHAFNQPSPDAYFWNGDPVKRSPVGFRVGAEIPASPFCLAALLGQGCAQAGVGFGYTPYPAFASVDFHLRFAIR